MHLCKGYVECGKRKWIYHNSESVPQQQDNNMNSKNLMNKACFLKRGDVRVASLRISSSE